MKTDNGYPYNFELKKIEEMVDFFLAKNNPEKALTELDLIEDSYFLTHDKIDYNRPENEHLMGYLIASLGYEEGEFVTDGFHSELKKMILRVKKEIEKNSQRESIRSNFDVERFVNSSENKKKEKSIFPGLNTPAKGIILHYLFNYGPEDFEFTSDYKKLTGYLETLKLGGSGSQAYNKGIVLLPDEKRNRKGKMGVISKEEFLRAIKFLKTYDTNAYEAAVSDFNYYCVDELNQDEDKTEIFFKN